MKGLKLFYLVFAAAFLIPFLIFLVMVTKVFIGLSIKNNGIETTAIVYDMATNTSENDVDYYRLYYVFKDENGIEHKGETNDCYTYYDASKYYNQEVTLSIIYDPNTFNSVQSDYTGFEIILIILPLVSIIGFIFAGALIKDIVYDVKAKKALANGTEVKATILSSNSSVTVNGVPYYKLKFEYDDINGTKHEQKTKSQYSFKEASYYEAMGTFKVKYIPGFAAISEPVDYNVMDNSNPLKPNCIELKKCQYCGSIVDDNTTTCPHCGSNDFDYIVKQKKTK